VLLAEFDAVGLGVEDILMAASSCDMSDMLAVETEVKHEFSRRVLQQVPKFGCRAIVWYRRRLFSLC
jgi:hypothetical protein